MALTLKPPKPPKPYYDPTTTNMGLGSNPRIGQPGGPGTSVYDPSGGYYDPTRSIYVPGGRGVSSAIPTASKGPTPPPPPGPGAGAGSGKSSTPYDYLAGLTQDPQYIYALNAFNQQKQSAMNLLGNQVRQQVISSGYIPNMGTLNQVLAASGAPAGYADFLDSATLAAAKNNPMSQAAQLNKSYNQNLNNLGWQLSGMGTGAAARSGQNVNDVNQYTNQFDTTSYGQMQDLLSALGGNVNNYLGTQMQAQAQFQNAAEAVAQRLAMMAAYGYNPGGGDGSGGTPTSPQAPDIPAYSTGVAAGPGRGTGVTVATDYGKNAYDVGGQYVVAPGTPRGHWDPNTGQWVAG
jgi:hypothetical protein